MRSPQSHTHHRSRMSAGALDEIGSLAGNRRAATPATHVRRGFLEAHTAAKSSAPPNARFRYPYLGSRLIPPRKRSEGETTTDRRSSVVVGVIGDAGTMRNGNGQTAAHPG